MRAKLDSSSCSCRRGSSQSRAHKLYGGERRRKGRWRRRRRRRRRKSLNLFPPKSFMVHEGSSYNHKTLEAHQPITFDFLRFFSKSCLSIFPWEVEDLTTITSSFL
jgi:hypothetical protein